MKESMVILIGIFIILGLFIGMANAQNYGQEMNREVAKKIVDQKHMASPYTNAKSIVMDNETAYVEKNDGTFLKVETQNTRVKNITEITYAEFKTAQEKARGNIQNLTPTFSTSQ